MLSHVRPQCGDGIEYKCYSEDNRHDEDEDRDDDNNDNDEENKKDDDDDDWQNIKLNVIFFCPPFFKLNVLILVRVVKEMDKHASNQR